MPENQPAAGRTGLLLINLGTPDGPDPTSVRRYLKEFLSDPRVVDISPLGRWLLVNLFILPFRPRKSSEAYHKVWTPQGSPLLVHSLALRDAMRVRMGDGWRIELGMRYANPSIASAVAALRQQGIDRIVAAPLFPQYASSSTGSALEELYRITGRELNVPTISTLAQFYDEPTFIDAFAAIGAPHLAELKPDHVLFSFHGLPVRQIRASDTPGTPCAHTTVACPAEMYAKNSNCYRAQSFNTAWLIAQRLSLAPDSWSVSFQSRLGRTPWIGPHTDVVLPQLAARGIKRVLVFCPAFVADCLETLEEIGLRGRDQFRGAGGDELRLVPSLNATPAWVEGLATLVERHAGAVQRRALPTIPPRPQLVSVNP